MSDDPALAATRSAEPDGQPGGHGQGVRTRVAEEVKRFLIMFLYLWLWSILFEVYRFVVLRQAGINAVSEGFAFVNALVLAKVMLIAEDLKLGRRWLRPEPLIYPILGESIIFAVVFIVFHVAEHVVIGLFKGETIATSVPAIGGGGLAGLLAVALIYFVALVPFFAVRNVGRELGEGRLKAMLFGGPNGSAEQPLHLSS